MKNQMCIEFDSKSENEAFARVVAAAFATQLNPNLEEIDDIKTVVSEAVTNAIVHGYQSQEENSVFMECIIDGMELQIIIMDHGVGIEDVEKARQPTNIPANKPPIAITAFPIPCQIATVLLPKISLESTNAPIRP